MSEHRFHVGDLVRTQFSVSTSIGETFMNAVAGERLAGIYEVSKLLPELDNGEPQYRIRRIGEPERVVRESQLTSATLKQDSEKPKERPQAHAGVQTVGRLEIGLSVLLKALERTNKKSRGDRPQPFPVTSIDE